MASLDALRHVTIGQYYPGDSAIHRLDPRAKLLAAGAAAAAAVLAAGYVANVALLAVLVAAVLAARLPLRTVLANVVPALPIIALFALMQLLFYGVGPAGAPSRVLVDWGIIVISSAGVRLVVVSLLRFLSLVLITALLTNTTTVGRLTYGVERLLAPLDAARLPGHELALVMAIALRFLPILGEQMQSIAQAQALRGVSERRTRWQVAENARRVAALIVPLFADAYRRSEEMTQAMLARCYQGGRGRTHLIRLALRPSDYVAVSLSFGLVAAIVASNLLALP